MTIRICTRTRKRIFKNAADAKRSVAHWLSMADPAFEATAQSVYRCVHCRKWHITGLAPEVTREITRAKRRASA